ncbi:MAG TPA: dynamin family protein [Candidatus Nitrosotenuis sp.]|nr:dynamin family protein [Candidatus Nitrosotenuis sp.]
MAELLGADRLAGEARSLAQRIEEGRFYVACIGQFKRGKSSLIGALIGEPVLPAGVIPVTSVPTVVRYGPSRTARVQFRDGRSTEISFQELNQFVSEEHNPENAKKVDGVEVFVSSALLAEGMCLVDTPGLGSVFGGGSAATLAYVPHIDAAIVVVGADPPLAGEELGLVETVSKQVRDLLVVLNKADRTTDAERAVAKEFTRKVLEKKCSRRIETIYEVSALEKLQGQGPQRDWPGFLAALDTLVRKSGRTMVRSAGERGLRRLTEELLAVVTEERDALLTPIEEFEQRIARMQETIRDSQRALQDLSYLLMAEQRRLSDMFLDRRKKFLRQNAPAIHAEFRQNAIKLRQRFGPAFRREAMHAAQQIVERHIRPWLESEQEQAEAEYQSAAVRFVNLANEFLRRLSESGVPELARMPNALDPEIGFRVRSRFAFESLITIAQPASPFRYLADVALGLLNARRIILAQADEFVDHLMESNSARVQSDVVERVQESRGQLEAEIRRLLLEIGHIAQRALAHAREAKAAGDAAVEFKLAGLKQIEAEALSFLAARS